MRIYRHLLSVSLALVGATLTSCATTNGDPSATVNTDAYSVAFQGSRVEVTCRRPMVLGDFLKMAQAVTGRIYIFKSPVPGGVRWEWVGTVNVERAEFDDFVATMLKVNGMTAEARRHGDVDFIEVIPFKRG
jgi:hypothetical protein